MEKIIELRDKIVQKGLTRANDHESRGTIVYTKVKHKDGVGFIYEANYDGHIYYVVFKERMYVSQNIIGYCFASEHDFAVGDAFNYAKLSDAVEQLIAWDEEIKKNI